MIRTGLSAALVGALLTLSAPPVSADKIHQTDGRTISDIKIVQETIAEVTYKDGNTDKSVASDKVLSIEFERMPRLVDEAATLQKDGDLLGALDTFDVYVDGQIKNPSERRYKWAPAFAAWRVVGIQSEIADLDGVIQAASRLITSFPESRYVPFAYLAKSGAQVQSNKGAAAQKTLEELARLIESKSLSKRWDLECKLGLILADGSTSGAGKRERLEAIASEAGNTHPTVRNRAYLGSGETYLVEAESDRGKASSLREKARGVFEQIVADPRADEETLAGAHTGLGHCLYAAGADPTDDATLRKAVMHYLRVVVLYEAQSRYVPDALLGAVRCFDLLKDGQRRYDMRRQLETLYPNSPQTAEAQRYK